jgi:hypothetical protein
MRAYEFIREGKSGKLNTNQSDASTGVMKSRDIGGYDRVYHMNRLSMAMAMADGKSKDAVEMDISSFADKYNTLHPYTEEEYNMYLSATNTVPTDKKDSAPYSRSKESDDVNKQSLVKGFQGFN